jgi:hypothetical protein
MKYPIHIRFAGLEESNALISEAHALTYGLAWVDLEIITCWVGIHADPTQQPSGGIYSVRVDVLIPGHELVTKQVQHDDVHRALIYAFQELEEQLKSIAPRDHDAQNAVTVNGQL